MRLRPQHPRAIRKKLELHRVKRKNRQVQARSKKRDLQIQPLMEQQRERQPLPRILTALAQHSRRHSTHPPPTPLLIRPPPIAQALLLQCQLILWLESQLS